MRPILFNDLMKINCEVTDISNAFWRTLDSGRYIGGPSVTDFERAWANDCGAEYCAAVSSGFSALQLIIRALDWKHVFYPPLTCMPTPLAIQEGGASADPLHNPTRPDYVMSHIDHVPTVAVWLYGIINPSLESTSTLVEDAAQAHGPYYRNLGRASKSVAASWSFYPTKNLGAMGDAGAVTTNNPDLAREIRYLRSYAKRGGINARMDPLQAEILLAKLPHLERWGITRHYNATIYSDKLRGLPLVLPTPTCTNWHQYPVRLKKRGPLRTWLNGQGIETLVHYDKPAIVPGKNYTISLRDHWAHDWSQQIVSLPVGPHLSTKDIYYVCDKIKEFFDANPNEEVPE